MSLRVKLAIAMVALAAGATALAGFISYASTGRELRERVDRSIEEAAVRFGAGEGAGEGDEHLDPRPPGAGRGPGTATDDDAGEDAEEEYGEYPRSFTQILVQAIGADGTVLRAADGGALPVSDIDRAVAAGASGTTGCRDLDVDGEDYRVITVGLDGGGAVQLARSLGETNEILDTILDRTLLIVIAMSALAIAVALFVAQQVTRRLVRLTEVASSVAASGDVEVHVPVDGRDETGRLGRAFTEMLASLARSRRSQQQLVQDAGHELRTPLTSLRTNISVMRRFEELSPSAREQLLDDLDVETRELTDLVNELVELATDLRDDEARAPVEVGDLARAVAEKAMRRSGRQIRVDADGSVVHAQPQAIERALANLVGNAVKFSAGDIEIVCRRGRVDVLDRGPGIAADDLPHLFDRFYRSVQSRSLPGSGLGLSIVRDVVERHGGTVHAANREGGGAALGFTLPVEAS